MFLFFESACGIGDALEVGTFFSSACRACNGEQEDVKINTMHKVKRRGLRIMMHPEPECVRVCLVISCANAITYYLFQQQGHAALISLSSSNLVHQLNVL